MGEKYVREYPVCCPRTLQKGKHEVEYAKATCTRVPDTLLHFHCTINGKCKDCERDYQEYKKPRYEYGKKKTGQKFIPEYSGFQSNIYIAVFFDLQGFLGSRTGKEDIQVTKR